MDVFEKHRVAASIKADMEATIKHPIMKAFRDGLQFKSAKTAEKDEQAVRFLLTKLEMYMQGWIGANNLSTKELYIKSVELDRMASEVFSVYDQMNDVVNALIKTHVAPNVPKESLDKLRELEKQIKRIRTEQKNQYLAL